MTKQPQRIGLLGGSFDPVHLGHLMMAQDALEQAQLDEVRFIPAVQSPFKDSPTVATQEQRIVMLEAALEGQVGMVLDTSELEAGGESYSVLTAERMRACFPDSELFWIIGADHLPTLERWHRAQDLAGLVTFLCVGRPGYDFDASSLPCWVKWLSVEAHTMNIASSDIRQRIASGKASDLFVPHAVHSIILNQALYK